MAPVVTTNALSLDTLRPSDEGPVQRWLTDFLRHHNRAWVHARGLGWSDAELDAQMLATDLVGNHWRQLVRASRRDDHAVLVCRVEHRPVGGVWASARYDDYLGTPSGYLNWIYVEPWARGHHVGRFLVESAMAWMRQQGLRSAAVNVLADNTAARALYASCGLDVVADVRMMGKLDGPRDG